MTVVARLISAVLLVLAAVVGGVAVAAPASACSCAPVSAQESYDRADAVFTGRLTRRTQGLQLGLSRSTGDPVALTFAVDAVYKGDVAAEQDVITAIDGASCGLELVGEGPFLVFALADGSALTANLCGGTTDDVARVVWTAAAPAPGRVTADLPGPSRGLLAAGALAAVLAAAGAVVLLLARRRRAGPPAG